MVRRIVVAYDSSDLSRKAIEEAKVQATLTEDTMIDLVTVVTPGITSNDTAANGNLSMSDAEKMYPELNKIKGQLEAEGYRANVEIITDFSQKNPGVALCDYAEDKMASLIIVGHRGLSNLKKLFLGSVSSSIVQRATCHVLIIN